MLATVILALGLATVLVRTVGGGGGFDPALDRAGDRTPTAPASTPPATGGPTTTPSPPGEG